MIYSSARKFTVQEQLKAMITATPPPLNVVALVCSYDRRSDNDPAAFYIFLNKNRRRAVIDEEGGMHETPAVWRRGRWIITFGELKISVGRDAEFENTLNGAAWRGYCAITAPMPPLYTPGLEPLPTPTHPRYIPLTSFERAGWRIRAAAERSPLFC